MGAGGPRKRRCRKAHPSAGERSVCIEERLLSAARGDEVSIERRIAIFDDRHRLRVYRRGHRQQQQEADQWEVRFFHEVSKVNNAPVPNADLWRDMACECYAGIDAN